MENKNVGYMLISVSLLLIIIIFLFNSALKQIIVNSCGEVHGLVCPMNQTVNEQTYLSLAIVGLLIIVGLVLVFTKPQREIFVKQVLQKAKKREYDLSSLNSEEKQVFKLVRESQTIFQADLIEKTGFGKAKVTRILDRLEGRSLIERKRRGMTNVVVLR